MSDKDALTIDQLSEPAQFNAAIRARADELAKWMRENG